MIQWVQRGRKAPKKKGGIFMDNFDIFQTLNNINVNGNTETKNGLTYLSWAWAWSEVKKNFPRATYTVYENAQGWNYHTDGKTCWVKTGVTIDGLEHIEYLPVMDYKNNSIPADKVTSFDVNKAIQRSLTKACARHGLGLYIYAGEDLPEAEKNAPKPMITQEQIGEFIRLGIRIEKTLQRYEVERIEDLTEEQAAAVIAQKKAYDAQKKGE